MIKKEELVELMQKRLIGQPGNESAGSFDPQLVSKYIDRAFNTVLWEVFRGGTYNLDNYTKRFLNVAVTYDSAQELYFSDMPDRIVQLPRVGSGVMKIQTMKGTAVSFVPMANMEKELLDGQEIDLVSGIIRYIIRGDTIEYTNMTSIIAAATVKVDIVRPFDSYDWDEDVMIPSGQDQRLIDLVVSFASGQPIDDQLNNNQQDNRIAINPNKQK